MSQVSVALSGSGFRLSAHIGALQAIIDNGYEIVDISGTSGGSIVAAFFVAGFTPKMMLDIAHKAPLKDFINFSLIEFLNKTAMNDGSQLYNWIKTYLGTTTFAQTTIPLNIVATDLNKYGACVFNKTETPTVELALACKASAAIPFVFEAVQYDGKYLVDGGLSDDLPINYLIKENQKFAIDLFEPTTPLAGHVSIQTLIGRIVDTIINIENADQLDDAKNCVPIKITTPAGLSLDTNLTVDQIDQLYHLGYEATNIILGKLI